MVNRLLFLIIFGIQLVTAQNNLQKYSLNWGDYERTYYVYAPSNIEHLMSVSLLFHLHGGGGKAVRTPKLTFNKFNELAERDGFVVVYPQGIENQWNDGRQGDKVKAWRENIDDVGFISEIVKELEENFPINLERIFTTGMSNGGFMSTRLACDRSDLFRGAAIVTAQISEDYLPKCTPKHPMGILIMNGTADPLVPYNGGEIRVLRQRRGQIISTDEYVSFWKNLNKCEGPPLKQDLPDIKNDGSNVSREIYSNCVDRGALVNYIVHNGGHTWPGGKQYWTKRMIGTTNRDINAAEVIWDFFKSLD